MISLHFKTASITGTSLYSSIYFFILITGTVLVPSVIVVPCLLTSLSIIATTLSPYKPRSCLPFCPAPNKTYTRFFSKESFKNNVYGIVNEMIANK